MKNFYKSLLKIFNFKEKIYYMTIAELKAFNLRENKIEKEKRFRAYISEINQRYNKMRKRQKPPFGKAS